MTSPKTLLTFLICSIISFQDARSQNFENAGEYMGYISKANDELTATYLSYMSAVAHNRAKKVEKRRMDVVNAISETRYKIQGMPPWKGDRSYKDSTVSYLKMLNIVFNEDFAKIVNMEEIAEQSYDLMEAYMLAQEMAAEKLNEAARRQQETQKLFAEKYDIRLLNSVSELDMKSRQASALMKHHDEVYLIFFKPYKQEMYMVDAVNKKNILAIEENRDAMKKFAEEGLKKLKSIRGYNSDPTIIVACRTALDFYIKEAEQTQVIIDFFLAEENFVKTKKAFESKPASKRTTADIEAFNKAVSDFNNAVNNYNKTNKLVNKERDQATEGWNKAVKQYLDLYMPVQRKT